MRVDCFGRKVRLVVWSTWKDLLPPCFKSFPFLVSLILHLRCVFKVYLKSNCPVLPLGKANERLVVWLVHVESNGKTHGWLDQPDCYSLPCITKWVMPTHSLACPSFQYSLEICIGFAWNIWMQIKRDTLSANLQKRAQGLVRWDLKSWIALFS